MASDMVQEELTETTPHLDELNNLGLAQGDMVCLRTPI